MGSFQSPRTRGAVSVVLTIAACLLLVVLLKMPGIIISCFLAGAVWLMSTARPEASEEAALRTSIQLSAEELRDVMEEFERFETSTEPDAIADRTLYRPALLDLDSGDPQIERFHYQYAAAARYLRRLPAKLSDNALSTSQLEKILLVTDQRSEELRDTWMLARRAAKTLGTGYNKN